MSDTLSDIMDGNTMNPKTELMAVIVSQAKSNNMGIVEYLANNLEFNDLCAINEAICS